ncbi:hypothetical protein [Streptosporangium sp. NPDC000396]|uniref:hypothetical protein n=1 Tax=Streptosporangium sp. NPDC000396 TaxID=3366185 RepID=UPI0036B36A16
MNNSTVTTPPPFDPFAPGASSPALDPFAPDASSPSFDPFSPEALFAPFAPSPTPPSPTAAGPDVHITSDAIDFTRSRLENELKEAVAFVRRMLDTVHIDSPGFGLLGEIILGGTYRATCRQADTVLGEAEDVVDGWCNTLTIAKRNWRAAEDHSIIRHR